MSTGGVRTGSRREVVSMGLNVNRLTNPTPRDPQIQDASKEINFPLSSMPSSGTSKIVENSSAFLAQVHVEVNNGGTAA